jgi:hypothetical protein
MPAATLSVTQTPGPGAGSLGPGGQGAVLKGLPIPNPQKGGILTLALELDGSATQISAQIYGKDFSLLGETVFQGNWSPGWASLEWPNWNLPNGLYYVTLAVKGSPKKVIVKLVIMH